MYRHFPETKQDIIRVIETLSTIGLDAGRVIMDIYGRAFAVTHKADASPLTEADTAAETVIVSGLAAAFPDIPVIAEEAVAGGYTPGPSRRFFLVDPLDGSKEFIARNGEFTVNIALIENGAPVMGVVLAPALGRMWFGELGQGAFVAEVGTGGLSRRRSVCVRKAPDNGLTLVGSRSHGGGEADTRLSGLPVADFRAVGSSLKFCFLAQGEADLYPRFGRTMEWDTAAGDAILRAAGGMVLDQSGRPFAYGKRNQAHDTDFANGPFWAFGDRTLETRIFAATPQ